MSASDNGSDNGATVPAPLGEGLLDGEAGNAVVVFQEFLQQAAAAMNGQNQHNGATTAALRNHQQTLLSHNDQLKANKASIGDLNRSLGAISTSVQANNGLMKKQKATLDSQGALITNNTNDITNHKKLIDANTSEVASLKAADTNIEAKLQSHENWQNNYSTFIEGLLSKNESDVLRLGKQISTQALQHVLHDEKLDMQFQALETIGGITETQGTAIETTRARTIENANAINELKADMALEQVLTDARVGSLETTQNSQWEVNKCMAEEFQKMGNILDRLSVSMLESNSKMKQAMYDDDKTEKKLPKTVRGRFGKRRGKRGKRKAKTRVTHKTVSVEEPYKRAKLSDNENWTSVVTEAAAAATRNHEVAKVNAEKVVQQANAALAEHEQKEESRREEVQQQQELLEYQEEAPLEHQGPTSQPGAEAENNNEEDLLEHQEKTSQPSGAEDENNTNNGNNSDQGPTSQPGAEAENNNEEALLKHQEKTSQPSGAEDENNTNNNNDNNSDETEDDEPSTYFTVPPTHLHVAVVVSPQS